MDNQSYQDWLSATNMKDSPSSRECFANPETRAILEEAERVYQKLQKHEQKPAEPLWMYPLLILGGLIVYIIIVASTGWVLNGPEGALDLLFCRNGSCQTFGGKGL